MVFRLLVLGESTFFLENIPEVFRISFLKEIYQTMSYVSDDLIRITVILACNWLVIRRCGENLGDVSGYLVLDSIREKNGAASTYCPKTVCRSTFAFLSCIVQISRSEI
jgi:hypothetical protein